MKIELKGHLQILLKRRKSGIIIPVYDGRNAIAGSLGIKEYLSEMMQDGTLDYALDDLFTDDDQQYGGGSGTQDGKDGILCADSTAAIEFTTITTTQTASNTFAKKWKGEIEFSSSQTIDEAFLGWNFVNGYTDAPTSNEYGMFQRRYAKRSFTGVSVASADKMIFNWEVYV